MIKKSIFFSLVFFLLLTIITPITHTAEQTVFGPQNFEIGRWHLHLSRHSFSVSTPGEGNITITKNTPEMTIDLPPCRRIPMSLEHVFVVLSVK